MTQAAKQQKLPKTRP